MISPILVGKNWRGKIGDEKSMNKNTKISKNKNRKKGVIKNGYISSRYGGIV